jgi:mono/diheme cytochrome c family protein
MRGWIYATGVGGWALAMIMVAGAGAAGQSPAASGAAGVKNPVASSPESIAAGKAVYQEHCATCHGTTGKGRPPSPVPGVVMPSNLIDDKWDHGGSDGEIFDSIKKGIGPSYKMEPWEDRLSDTDVWNVINYIRSLAASS